MKVLYILLLSNFLTSGVDLTKNKIWQLKGSTVERIYDADTNTVCYVVPATASMTGEFIPAISCVAMKMNVSM